MQIDLFPFHVSILRRKRLPLVLHLRFYHFCRAMQEINLQENRIDSNPSHNVAGDTTAKQRLDEALARSAVLALLAGSV